MLFSNKKAFTMIELIIVVVILGILAAVAIPRLMVSRDDAYITKGRNEVASIRSAIEQNAQTAVLKGDFANRYPPNAYLFGQYPGSQHASAQYLFRYIGLDIKANESCKEKSTCSAGSWHYKDGNYWYAVTSKHSVKFTYCEKNAPSSLCSNNGDSKHNKLGKFICDENDSYCQKLTR